MTKPIGAICNLDCKYCFYLEKEDLYPDTGSFRMSDEVLDAYVRQYIESQDVPEISFAWQGGEPTLMGVNFFRKVVDLQRRHAGGKRVVNALQTNGTLLDDEWGRFLHDNGFLIGLSVDGPRQVHDKYRVDKSGKGTFDGVMRGLDVLQKHEVEYNTLTVVSRANAHRPLDVYRFLKSIGSRFHQFIPLVERAGEGGSGFAGPPSPEHSDGNHSPVTPWSVEPLAYGQFLRAIFDEWVRHDVGRIFVQLFEVQLGIWMGRPAGLCVFAEQCGRAMALEHNGDLYACDHYVYPEYKLGNVTRTPLHELVESPRQIKFGADKLDTLPQYCRSCDVRFACNGECPKHRFITTPDGQPGLNYLCAGYKLFFHHVDPYMRAMAQLIASGRHPTEIMGRLARPDPLENRPTRSTGRNDPCPCGSGRKYKKCCGTRA
ncbi:MAG: anaerobic sulfatase maturase [Tepidisphaeraceae bacterium]